MKATWRSTGAGIALLAIFFVAAAPRGWAEPVEAAQAETANDVARFLAGLEPAAGSPLASLTRVAAWQLHARSLSSAWSKLEHDRLSRIRAWSAANLTEPQPVVLYMFSGARVPAVQSATAGLRRRVPMEAARVEPPSRPEKRAREPGAGDVGRR